MCHSGGVVQGGFVTGWIDAAMAHAIIAMTGHALTGVREACREAGMNDFLAKPVSLDDFRRSIPRCISQEPANALPVSF
jgi:CheY-like chemotaxis protein